ncbi:MAG: CRISPR-associated endonuclease Cas2 [Chloroflexota bacterium]
MWVVVCYDIPDDRRRLRAARVCLGFGMRVQRSVFEAELTKAQLKRLKAKLERVINREEDSVRIYKLCVECIRQTEVLCGPGVVEAKEVLIF